MDAELTYLFRHAVLRDAAYDLQLPGDRAKLHELAFHLIEQAFGGRPPAPPPLGAEAESDDSAHPCDAIALELADHAKLAAGEDNASEWTALLKLYLYRGANYAGRRHQSGVTVSAWLQFAELVVGPQRGEALRRAGAELHRLGESSRAEDLILQALDLQEGAGDTLLGTLATLSLAELYSETGRTTEADGLFLRVLDHFRSAGPRRRLDATTLSWVNHLL